MAMLNNKFYIGSVSNPMYYFTNRSLSGAPEAVTALDVIGNELSIDTFTIVVRYNPDANLVYAPRGKDGYRDVNGRVYLLRRGVDARDYLKNVAYGTPIFWYINNAAFFKGYVSAITRVAVHKWKITAISGVGLLDAKNHAGGMYTSGVSASSVIASIVGDSFSYTIDSDVASVVVYNRLPYDTARRNLNRLLFVVGASMLKGAGDTDYQFAFLNSEESVPIPDSRVTLNGSVEYRLPSNRAEVTEHSFFSTASDESVTLFDNTSGVAASGLTVIFDDPMHDLTTTGSLTVSESNCNYAVVSGTGTLVGKKYRHTTFVVAEGTGTDNIMQVKDNELISAANSRNVAKRVLSFYSQARKIRAKINIASEKCGTYINLHNAFLEPVTGFISKMNMLVTGLKGADCEIIEGYAPYKGNNYTHRMLVKSSGTVTVPDGVTQMRIVLIQGGSGGQGGFNGADGYGYFNDPYEDPPERYLKEDIVYNRDNPSLYTTRRYWYSPAATSAGQGGSGGTKGQQGKVAEFEVNVTPGDQISVSIGQKGTGGARNGGAGTAGGHTTVTSSGFGTLSSEAGAVRSGYYDFITGDTFAYEGSDGTRGGNGGISSTNDGGAGNLGGDGLTGGSVGNFSGGTGGTGTGMNAYASVLDLYYEASGGGGGGAANGANGLSGQSPDVSVGQTVAMTLAYGGSGASAVAPSSNLPYGCGGNGGHGGGGGGNAGGGQAYRQNGFQPNLVYFQPAIAHGGYGGLGSAGGDGGPGVALIYY